MHSISTGNETEGISTTATKNHDLQFEPAQYASVHELHDKTITVPHQTAPSGDEYALSAKTTNDGSVKQPKPTPGPMEYAVVELQKKTTESTPQQLITEYNVIEDNGDDVKKPANKGVSIMTPTSVTVEQWVFHGSRDPMIFQRSKDFMHAIFKAKDN